MAHRDGKRLLLWAALLAGAGGTTGVHAQGAPAHGLPRVPAVVAFSSVADGQPADTPEVALMDDGASIITITAPGSVPGLAVVPGVAPGAVPDPATGEVAAQAGAGAWNATHHILPAGRDVVPPSSPAGRFAPSWAICLFGLALLGLGWRLRRYGPAVPAAA